MVFLVQMKLIHKKNIYNITKWDFDAADLKIGWKDKDLYYLVTDKILFPTQTTWDMNFIFYMQNRYYSYHGPLKGGRNYLDFSDIKIYHFFRYDLFQ